MTKSHILAINCLISSLNKYKIFTLCFDMGTCFYVWAKHKNFQNDYMQIIWKKVRRWHQLTHLHIHIDCSRTISWNMVKLYNSTSSLFLIRFSSIFHCSVWIFIFLLNFLNLDWIYPLSTELACVKKKI